MFKRVTGSLTSEIAAFFTLNRRIDELIAQNKKLGDRLDSIERKTDRIENFSHGARAVYVGGNRVLMKAIIADHQIAFFVEANDRLLSPWFIATGGYETALTNFFVKELRPDSHCIDIGANFGFFTCLMARFCPNGRVLGIEADRHVFELARDNTFINGFGHAEVLHAAASKERGQMTLYRRLTRSGNTSIASMSSEFLDRIGEQPSEPFTVDAISVDDLLSKMARRIDFIKIDVEGAEPLALQGAATAIAENPNITIVMEWSPGQVIQAGFDLDAFIANIGRLHLKAFDIMQDGALMPLLLEGLSTLPYRAGIVLKKAG